MNEQVFCVFGNNVDDIASTYSFYVESELFYQLNPEQQKLWRKEIESAVKFGINYGIRNVL